MEDLLAECLTDYVADLIEIEDFHTTQKQNPGMKLVVTDGIVSSMNLNRNEKTGNCVLWIEPADVNYGYEEEDLPDTKREIGKKKLRIPNNLIKSLI